MGDNNFGQIKTRNAFSSSKQVHNVKLTHRFGFVILAGHSSTALPLGDNLLREVPLGQRPLPRLLIRMFTSYYDHFRFGDQLPEIIVPRARSSAPESGEQNLNHVISISCAM